MKLSILDQSPIISGLGARRAVDETLALARRAETLGYERYWLAEHHAIGALADPCPEVLLARLGAETRRMRVGTGGVLLPYYSAFRTAETFRMLEALYPGRIDLGIGRAPDAEVDAPRVERLEHPERLGGPERAVVGKQHAAGADPHAPRLGAQTREQHLGAGIRQGTDRVVLGEPVALIAERLGAPRQRQCFVHRAACAEPADDGRLVEDRELHGDRS